MRPVQLTAQRNDLLRGVHTQRREGAGAVTVDGAVAHPVLRQVAGVDDHAAVQRLGHGVQGGHADAAGQVYDGLAAGRQPYPLHLRQHALYRVVDVDGAVGDAQMLHQRLGVVDVRLDAAAAASAATVELSLPPEMPMTAVRP